MTESIRNVIILSIWDDIWSLGEGSGVADELHFIENLSRMGTRLHFLIPEPLHGKNPIDDENVFYYTYPNIFRSLDWLPGVIKRFLWPALFPLVVNGRLERLASQVKPELILGFTYYAFNPLNRVGRRLGIPTVVKLFGVMYLDRFDFPRIKYLWKSLEQLVSLKFRVDHYIILNDGTRGKMALTKLGIPEEKISFLPNGMDVEWANVEVDRAATRERLGLARDRVIVITYSRLVKSKRIELLLRAVAMLDRVILDRIALVIGGDGPEMDFLKKEAARLGIADKVTFTGAIKHDDVVYYLKASDIFAATNELTNMSLPPCEAILCGVPVVAFDVSGTSEVVQDGKTGLLVENGNVEEFSKKLTVLIEDEELRKTLGKNAAEFARGYFVSWERRIEMEVDVLKMVARGHEQPKASE
ncbi:MAG: hypothetical protein B6D63_00530 [Candidatus Latescibacteria bacterium 4484_7]|nr:MAG: hypothetical protein B6D63_00530 [Candidatus Latescibacteria bacterium 4484_7]